MSQPRTPTTRLQRLRAFLAWKCNPGKALQRWTYTLPNGMALRTRTLTQHIVLTLVPLPGQPFPGVATMTLQVSDRADLPPADIRLAKQRATFLAVADQHGATIDGRFHPYDTIANIEVGPVHERCTVARVIANPDLPKPVRLCVG